MENLTDSADYHDKIIMIAIEYYLHIFDSKIALYNVATNVSVCFVWYTVVSGNLLAIITIINYYLYHDNKIITIAIIYLSALNYHS